MSSIHDVAAMAGVSTATVSKHINKSGYVSPEKRDAIDHAIETLDYAPNRSARMLKTRKSEDILFVVPNMMEKIYRELAESTSLVLGNDYRVIMQLTKDDPARESKILQDCLNNPCAGVLLVTCQPESDALLAKLQRRVPVVFLMREPQTLPQHSFVGFNHFESVYAMTHELLHLGCQDIGLFTGDSAFSCEAECIRAFGAAYQNKGLPIPENRVFSAPFSKEVTFLQVMPLFDSGSYPRAFICTSQVAAKAISDVAFFRNLELGHDLLILALGEDSWYNSMFVSRIICTYRDARKLGSVAADALLDHIKSPLVYEPVNIKLQDGFSFERLAGYIQRLRKSVPQKPPAHITGKLRLLFNQSDSGTDALKSLLPQYTQVSHTEVELVTLPHEMLHEELLRGARGGSSQYDLLSVDAPWLSYFSTIGAVCDLTALVQESDIPSRLAPQVLENVGTYQGRIWGIPYTHSLQMLFYRKDLFEDPEIAAEFYQQYRVKLAPPKDWNMFNIIAAFFTQARNAKSPTKYGTSLFGCTAAHLCTELYPRIWAYNGSIMDSRGFVRLYSQENRKAYQSLVESFRCSPEETLSYQAYDGLEQLMQGSACMCVSFSNNASVLANNGSRLLQNNIGFAPIPSHKPVISGWNICINPNSQNCDQAWDFIQWFSSMEIASAYTILGGAAPMGVLLEHESLVQLYPWNTLACKEYYTGMHREAPTLPEAALLDQAVVETILAGVLYDFFDGKASLDNALRKAHKTLCEYAEGSGYPKNISFPSSIV